MIHRIIIELHCGYFRYIYNYIIKLYIYYEKFRNIFCMKINVLFVDNFI